MAKAKATCTCATCGAKFEKGKICYNRRDANSWEEWAVDHYDECPKCYGKRKAAEEAAKPFTVTLTIDSWYPPAIRFDASGDTRPHKDDLIDCGYQWGDVYHSRHNRKMWAKIVSIGDDVSTVERLQQLLKREFVQAAMMGANLDYDVSDASVDFEEQVRIAISAVTDHPETIVRVQRELAALEEPVRPACLPTGRWNGKVYGQPRYGNYRIYINNEEHKITAAEFAEITRYQKDMAEYRSAVAKIMDRGN